MQPLSSVLIRRPFHWGIVVVIDHQCGDVPDVVPESSVTASPNGLVVLVRHAQDVDSFEGDIEFAEAEVEVRLLVEADPQEQRRVLYSGHLNVPSGRLSVGDADADELIGAHRGWNDVVVSVGSDVDEDDLSPDAVRIDLLPVESDST